MRYMLAFLITISSQNVHSLVNIPGASRKRAGALIGLILWLSWPTPGLGQGDATCQAPAPVCAARAAVFAVSSFDPFASAVRIGPDLLVTNRHVVADEPRAEVILPDGRRVAAEVVPTDYPGDLILLRADGLGAGPVLEPTDAALGTDLYTVGVDVEAHRVRTYAPGRLLLAPAPGKPLARLHHSAHSQPGNSGGALVDGDGRLAGIVTSGGDGRNEAVPAAGIAVLRARSGPRHGAESARLGAAYRACYKALDLAGRAGRHLGEVVAEALSRDCGASGNRQLFDLAAQAYGRAGRLEDSRAMFELALDQDPHAINSRVGLVVTLHLGQHFADAVPHIEWLLDVMPDNLEVLGMALISGKRAGAPDLAERAAALIETHHPLIAPSARKFLDEKDPAAPR